MMSASDTEQFELKSLDDDLLEQVIDLLSVEQQFLLLRVSRRFSRLIYNESSGSGTLTKVTKIVGITEKLVVGGYQIGKALKKLPNLKSIGSDDQCLKYALEDHLLNHVSRTNPRLVNFGDWGFHSIIRYINMVKKVNPNYDEREVRQFFPLDKPVGDLNLRLEWDSMDSDQQVTTQLAERIQLVEIRFFAIQLPSNLNSVRVLHLSSIDDLAQNSCQLFQDITAHFPNIEVLRVSEREYAPKMKLQTFFNCILSLKFLQELSLDSKTSTRPELANPPWTSDDTDILSQLLMKPTLKHITFVGIQKSEHLVIRTFMDCPRTDFDGFSVNDGFCCSKSAIVIKGYPQHSLVDIYHKFRKVDTIRLIFKRKVSLQSVGVRKVMSEWQQLSNMHRNKMVKIQIESSRFQPTLGSFILSSS